MELDELKSLWQTTDARVAHMQAALDQTRLRNASSTHANQLRIEPIFEIVMAALTLLFAGNFMANNWAEVQKAPLLAIPVGSLYPLSIYVIRLAILRLILVSKLDAGNSVVESQQAVAEMRKLAVRGVKVLLLIGIPLWMLPILILQQLVMGYSSLANLNWTFVVSNILVGAVFSGAMILLARRLGSKSKFFRAIDDIFAGDAIARAEQELREVKNFTNS